MIARYTFVALIFAVFALVSCSEKENTEVTQYEQFSTYLKGKYPEGEFRYDSIDRKMFRLFINEVDNSANEAVAAGDSIYIDYILSEFSTSGSSDNGRGGVFYTNMPSIVNADEVLDPTYWPTDRKGLALGSTPLVGGLNMGLPGCHEGDTVLFFLPSALNFGSRQVGMVPPETPVVWTLIIKEVIK